MRLIQQSPPMATYLSQRQVIKGHESREIDLGNLKLH